MLELILANVRTPDIRRGDLRAQTAANHLAGRRLQELVERRGRDTIEQAFDELISYAERRTREAIRGRYLREPTQHTARWRATAARTTMCRFRSRSRWPTAP